MDDLTGKKYGRLTVLSRADTPGKKGAYWICACDCGKQKIASAHDLKNGHVKSCGCLRIESCKRNATALSARKDISGQTFGDVYVIGRTNRKLGTQYYYKCRCLRCGKEFETVGARIKRGDTTSCGCLQIEMAVNRITSDAVFGTKLSAIGGKIRSNNTSGVTGVSASKYGWIAYIGFQGKHYVLYQGADFNEAVRRRKAAEKELHGEFLEWYYSTYPEKSKKREQAANKKG